MRRLLLALAVAAATAPAFADQLLDPKDALAPIFRENPKLADPLADRARLRNEGIAHYEGGLTLDRGVQSFQSAYEIGHDPADAFDLALVYMRQNNTAQARVWVEKSLDGNEQFAPGLYLLGLIEKLDGHADAAHARWTAAVALAPTDASLHYQLAMLASAAKDEHTFLQELLRALELDPDHKSSLYQMYRYYQAGGNREMAAATLKRFNAAKATEKFSRKDRLFDDSLLVQPIRADARRAAAGFPPLGATFAMEVAHVPLPCAPAHLAKTVSIAAPVHEWLVGVCADGQVLRIDGDAATVAGRFDGVAEDVKVAWLDAQGPRLIVAGPAGVRLSSPLGKGALGFTAIDDKPAHRLVLADFDHDGSLDILTDADPAPLAKAGDTYRRVPGAFAGGGPGVALKAGGPVLVADLRRRGLADLVAADGAGVRVVAAAASGYRDTGIVAVGGDAPVRQLAVADLDNRGVLDAVAATNEGVAVIWGIGGAAKEVTKLALDATPARIAMADLGNAGRRDIVAIDLAGKAWVFANTGPHAFERRVLSEAVPAPTSDVIALANPATGLVDLAYADADGLVVLRNRTEGGGAVDLLLTGRRSPPTGQMTQVELRKGALYEYAQSDGGLLHLGLGREAYAEVVRLEWPNGFVENKIKVDAAQQPYVYLESERIAGSCPTVFVRHGDEFRYVTDAMITTAIGILAQRDTYFGFGEREHVVIPPGLLTERDGRLDLRVTEELRETTYLGNARLLAVDHPAGARLATTERLAPAGPEASPTYLARRLVPAARATFEGRDVTAQLASAGGSYANTVHRTRNPGFAETSTLELQLGDDVDPARVDALYATGWFLAFDSSAVIGAFKGEAPGFVFPELQELVDGVWRGVGFVGIPAGQNRTAVLRLPHGLASRTLRIVSGFSVYWDELAFSVAGEAASRSAALPLLSATLRFHGFSRPVSREPDLFDYQTVEYGMLWSPMPGRFTDYGDVLPLMGSGGYLAMGGGDEVALSFAAPSAPPPEGDERSYVLVLDGHVKDADRYTAAHDSVDPMPYPGMTAYPITADDARAHEPAASRLRRTRPGLDYTLGAISAGLEQIR